METRIDLGVDREQYRKEQDKLLKVVLDQRFFLPWKNIGEFKDERSLQHDANLELYITNRCNQKCEYCYLYHNDEIYPKECNNDEVILHNLELLYRYCIANGYHIPEIDMFSGEIWHTDLGLRVLDTTLKYTTQGLSYDHILISSNCSFVQNPDTFSRIQYYIDEFNFQGHKLIFSISIDGKEIDSNGRERANGTQYTDDFYDTLFAFAKHNNFYFHPMVSAHNIDKWPENFKWWIKMCGYYGLDFFDIMLLEVRNDEWTDETIDKYCDFILTLADYFLQIKCHGDIKEMAHIFTVTRQSDKTPGVNGYYPWALNKTDSFVSCTAGTHLTVRLGDLAICPCHRTAYAKHLYGYFVVEDDMITGVRACNPQNAIKILMTNMKTAMAGCDCCLYKELCLKGCFGAQLEATGDMFFPCKTVCKFFKKKYDTLLQYYKDKGLFDYYKTYSVQESGADRVQKLLSIYYDWEASKQWLGNMQT